MTKASSQRSSLPSKVSDALLGMSRALSVPHVINLLLPIVVGRGKKKQVKDAGKNASKAADVLRGLSFGFGKHDAPMDTMTDASVDVPAGTAGAAAYVAGNDLFFFMRSFLQRRHPATLWRFAEFVSLLLRHCWTLAMMFRQDSAQAGYCPASIGG